MNAGQVNKLSIHATLQTLFGAENVETEYRFHPVRRWRFDYAIPAAKLAVEYHGHAGFIGKGVSGHSTIKGLTNDCEKMNQAHAHGWRVVAFTALHFQYKDRIKHKLTDVKSTLMDVISSMQTDLEN